MAVPKTMQTRYMDGSVQATQRTTQVTPSLHFFFIFVISTKLFRVISQQSLDTHSIQKKDVGVFLCCTTVPYRRLSFSKLSTETFSMHVR